MSVLVEVLADVLSEVQLEVLGQEPGVQPPEVSKVPSLKLSQL